MCKFKTASSDHTDLFSVQALANPAFSEEKKFTCDQCSSAFKTSDKLNRHHRFKHGINPYECEECDMRFEYHNELKNHVKTH